MTVHDADNPEDIKQIIAHSGKKTYFKVYIWVWSNFFEVIKQYFLFFLSLSNTY